MYLSLIYFSRFFLFDKYLVNTRNSKLRNSEHIITASRLEKKEKEKQIII